MTDVHSVKTRSYNMSQIRSRNTKPELLVRKFLFSLGCRYRLHDKKLPGKPDIVLPRYRTVIFVHGCFWHGHPDCRYATTPKTRTEWWLNKIGRNTLNDIKSAALLKDMGWNVIIVWECELKKNCAENTLQQVAAALAEFPRGA
jgi:DNA mismatch endonuclease (patch repair protein)